MPVDSIRYCLERATDAAAFEALCCDILSRDQYGSIEPIGGTGDGGRDAVYTPHDARGTQTVLAFSLRKDWKTKLREDCRRVHQMGHTCCRIVFAFVKQPTPTERDSAIDEVNRDFGWELELYGLERLRVQLSGRSSDLLSSYPSLFPPRFFANVGGELVEKEQRDIILIDHVSSDFAFSSWLARRLEIAGYKVCCLGLAPFGGLNLDESMRTLISRRAVKHVVVLSNAGVADSDFRGRCEASASITNCILPVQLEAIPAGVLSKRVCGIMPIDFAAGWAPGLSSLLRVLTKQGIPMSWDVQSGRMTALSSIIPEPLTKDEPEELYSNAFPVLSVPESILTVPLRRQPNPAQLQDLRDKWAFVLVGSTAISFQSPPEHDLIDRARRFAEALHLHQREYSGRATYELVCELIRRCMELACYRRGLRWCPDRQLVYFPYDGKYSRRISYCDVSGKNLNTGVTGRKSLFRPGPQPNEVYRYAVSPRFFASGIREINSWEVRLRLALRVTDDAGTPHSGRSVTTRRKAAAKNWFNQHWFAKTLAVMQHIGDDCGNVVIGNGGQRVQVSSAPKSWTCPVSIDSAAIDRMMAEQKMSRDELHGGGTESETINE